MDRSTGRIDSPAQPPAPPNPAERPQHTRLQPCGATRPAGILTPLRGPLLAALAAAVLATGCGGAAGDAGPESRNAPPPATRGADAEPHGDGPSEAGHGEPGGEEHGRDGHGDHGHEEHGHEEHGHDAHGPGVVALDPRAVVRGRIETAPASVREMPRSLTTTGKVGYDERRLARVTPRLPGRVQRVPVDLGDRVGDGDVLAVLDSVILGEAKAAYLRARAREEVARSHAERERALFAERITSELAAQEAEAHAREAAADLAAAAGTLRLYGLGRAEMEALSYDDPDLSWLTVGAPFSGRVVHRDVALGELAEPGDELFVIADLSTVWVWIDLFEGDLRHVQVGDPVTLTADAWPGLELDGTVAFVGDEVDPDTRTLRARVDLPNPELRLRPGMFARVSLQTSEAATPALTVPRRAVQRGDGDGAEAVVFVALDALPGEGAGDGGDPVRFRRQPVRLGRRSGDRVEILEGLRPGDPVVVSGAFLLESEASSDRLGGHHH